MRRGTEVPATHAIIKSRERSAARTFFTPAKLIGTPSAVILCAIVP
jgi:hypothetical protein